MTFSINCKDAGSDVCNHTVYGETEDEVFKNVKEHVLKDHGYTEDSWNEELAKNKEHYKKLIKQA